MSKKQKTKSHPKEEITPEVEENVDVEEEVDEASVPAKDEKSHHPDEMVKAFIALAGTTPDDNWTNVQLRKEIIKLTKALTTKVKEPSGYSLAMQFSAKDPNITRKELKAKVKEEIPTATDGSIESAHSQTRMVIRALIQVGLLEEDILDS